MSERITRVEISPTGVLINGKLASEEQALNYRRMMAEEQHFYNRCDEYPKATSEEMKWLGSDVIRPRKITIS